MKGTDSTDSSNGDDPGDGDVIEPDSVTKGRRASSSRNVRDDPFGLDDLAVRAVEVLQVLLGRAAKLARGVFLFAAIASVLGYVLGIAALEGGLRVFWIVVGGLLAAWAIGSVVIALWRLRLIRNGSDLLEGEIRTLIGGDRTSERTVIETIESTRGVEHDGIVVLARQFSSLREAVHHHTANFTQLTLALTSITTFPGLMALATVIGVGFLGVSLIFVLILIF